MLERVVVNVWVGFQIFRWWKDGLSRLIGIQYLLVGGERKRVQLGLFRVVG